MLPWLRLLCQVLAVGLWLNISPCLCNLVGTIAYPAGCTVVLINSGSNKQQHITNPGKKAITCVGWSDDGRYLVTGECGKLPCVRVWDMQDMSSMGAFSGHKYGISCVAFAPGNKYLVSVGINIQLIMF